MILLIQLQIRIELSIQQEEIEKKNRFFDKKYSVLFYAWAYFFARVTRLLAFGFS